MSRHVISAIRFPPGQESGTLECTCGAEMPSPDFAEHRRFDGQARRNVAPTEPARRSTACEPQDDGAGRCLACGRKLMLGKRRRDGTQLLQHVGLASEGTHNRRPHLPGEAWRKARTPGQTAFGTQPIR